MYVCMYIYIYVNLINFQRELVAMEIYLNKDMALKPQPSGQFSSKMAKHVGPATKSSVTTLHNGA